MRRFAHYDYWSDKVRKAYYLTVKLICLFTAWAKKTITAIAKLLSNGIPIKDIRDIRQTMYPLGKSETENIKGYAGCRIKGLCPSDDQSHRRFSRSYKTMSVLYQRLCLSDSETSDT